MMHWWSRVKEPATRGRDRAVEQQNLTAEDYEIENTIELSK